MTSTRRLRVALGTWVAIEATADSPTAEQAAIEAAYAAIGAVERWMHPYRDDSDLGRINSAPLHSPIEVQSHTWRVLQLARRLYDLTHGVFDPCLPHRRGRLPDIELNGHEPLLVCRAPVEVDLGGIAKGYAIDYAVATLQEHDCSAGLVNAGGDLRVFGERDEAILLRHGCGGDHANTTLRPLKLRDAALAVSDLDATERPAEHQGYYNRTRQLPTRRYAAVTAQTAVIADGLTKCVLLCPMDVTTHALRELQARAL